MSAQTAETRYVELNQDSDFTQPSVPIAFVGDQNEDETNVVVTTEDPNVYVDADNFVHTANTSQAEEDKQYQLSRQKHPPIRSIIIVTTAMFMGYAILVSFQHKLKVAYDINDDGSEISREFSVAVSFLYIGNLIFRLAHNFVFAPIRPRLRVYIAMCAMCLAMCILGVFVFAFNQTQTLAWVFIAYFLGGVGIGSFESNLLSAITPLGHDTKVWAIIGFPLGFATILVGGFFLTALGTPTLAIYLIVIGGLVLGMLVFFLAIPVHNIAHNANTFWDFIDNLKHFRLWLPKIKWHCGALLVDMFMVALFSGIMLYIFNDNNYVPLYGPSSSTLVSHDWFFVFYNMFTLAGDSLSRKLMYYMHLKPPMIYLIFSFGGAAICLSRWAIIAPLGIFLIMFANGAVYATTTRHIDQHVDKHFNLVALSVWLFVGDIGSVVGSNVLSYMDTFVCRHNYQYMCDPS